jgi:holo-[acyl-carrier protein] synthase
VVVGLGVDLIEIDRVSRSLERWGERLVRKLMDPEEAGRLPAPSPDRVHALAGAIALKEATSKALGTGWSRGVRWRDVVVQLSPTPTVRLYGRAAAVARTLGSGGRHHAAVETRGNLLLAELRLLS